MNSFNSFGNSIRNTIYYVVNYIYNFPGVDASLVYYYPLDSSNGNARTANYASGLPVYDASMMGLAMNTYDQNNFVTGVGDLSLNNTMGSSALDYVRTDTSFNLVPSRGLSISLWFSCSGQVDTSGTLISLYQQSIDSNLRVGLFGSTLLSQYIVPPPAVTYTATGTYTTSTYSNYTILTYTSGTGTFTPTNTNLKVGYIVVGGGSAGNPWGSGNNDNNVIKGGAGGNGGAISYSLLSASNLTINKNNICNIIVGSGSTSKDISGGTSSLNDTIIAQGGTFTFPSSAGVYTLFGNTNTATAIGGINNFPGGNTGAGGQPVPLNTSGGVGRYVQIFDISINAYYGGGGGGGGGRKNGTPPTGSGVNGGNGGIDGKGGDSYSPGYNGISNYGSGGGGGGGTDYTGPYNSTMIGSNGGNGGSGVVIIYFITIVS